MATETHIAGLDIHYENCIQQRCAWCGAVLISMDLGRMSWSLNEDGSDPGPPGCFEVGALVRCSYDGLVARWGEVGLSRTVKEVIEPEPHPEHEGRVKVPDDACARHFPLESFGAAGS